MSQKRRVTIELVLAVVAAAGSVWCWLLSQTLVTVAPVLPDEPQTTSVVYSPPLLFLMLALATVAGVLAVDGIARLRRARHATRKPSRAEMEFPVVKPES